MTTKHEKCRDCGDHHAPPSNRCERHEGWTNQETWAVALHVDNERAPLSEMLARVDRVEHECDCHKADECPDFLTAVQREVQSYVEDEFTAGARPGIREGLVQAALSRVNWRELAEHYITKARESASV